MNVLEPIEVLVFSPGEESTTITANFTAGEFKPPRKRWAAHRGPWWVCPVMVAGLQRLRDRLGVPITVINGYRPPRYNQGVGGAVDSQHLYGRAVDLGGLDPMRIARAAWEMNRDRIGTASEFPWSIGFSARRVHLDTRSAYGERPVLYGYDKLKGRSDVELIKILESEI